MNNKKIAEIISARIYMPIEDEDEFTFAVQLLLCRLILKPEQEGFRQREIRDGILKLLGGVKNTD
jgi:hypothetical protein